MANLSSPHQSAPTLLLVDDDYATHVMITRALRKLDVSNDLVTVMDGEQALTHLENTARANAGDLPPFIVLLDVNMPRMNGVEFCEAIARRNRFEQIVIFAFGTLHMPSHQRSKLDARVAGYISKDNIQGTLARAFSGAGARGIVQNVH